MATIRNQFRNLLLLLLLLVPLLDALVFLSHVIIFFFFSLVIEKKNLHAHETRVMPSSSSSSRDDENRGPGQILKTTIFATLLTTLASTNIFLFRQRKQQGQQQRNTKQKTLHKTQIRKLYRRVWNEPNQISRDHACSEYIHPEHILIDPSNPNPVPGVEAYCNGVNALRQALPTIRMHVDDMIEQGCKVAVQLSFVASLGERTAKWTGTAVMEFEDDLIVKTWVNTDSISAMIQLGLVSDLLRNSGSGSEGATTTAGGAKIVNKAPLRRDREAVAAAQALLGRTEPHPTEVLTGKEWLEYFDAIQEEEWEHGSQMSQKELELQQDDLSGLDVVV